jgi:hypothetical protein
MDVLWDIELDKGAALPTDDEIEICPMKTSRLRCGGGLDTPLWYFGRGEWFGGYPTHWLQVLVIVITCNPRSQSPSDTELTIDSFAPAGCPMPSPLLLGTYERVFSNAWTLNSYEPQMPVDVRMPRKSRQHFTVSESHHSHCLSVVYLLFHDDDILAPTTPVSCPQHPGR